MERATLLAVPDHHGRGPIDRSPPAVDFLRRQVDAGDEIALHGHRHLEARCAIALHPADLDCPPLLAALGDLVRTAAGRSRCETVARFLSESEIASAWS